MPHTFTHCRFIIAGLCLLLLCRADISSAQCTNWRAVATLTAGATCASNGSFTVALTGPDAANLTNVQYGIPIAPNGFAVPLNSSSAFSGVPPGTYQVSVVGDCGGAVVGRNTTITIPGNYSAPALIVNTAGSRASLSCSHTGVISLGISGGAWPYNFKLTAYPVAYTGPLTNLSGVFTNLPPGTYTIQGIDACQSGTVPVSYTVASLVPANAPYTMSVPATAGCDTLIVRAPYINGYNTPWASYMNDTAFKASIQVSGGISLPRRVVMRPDSSVVIRLPAGKTIRDLYGDTITYTITPPCGPSVTRQQVIQPPNISVYTIPGCNNDFLLSLSVSNVCLPVTYTLRQIPAGTVYGPYAAAGNSLLLPSLPMGSYTVVYTSGDGYTDSTVVSVSPVTSNPYRVNVINGAQGLQNRIYGFVFSTTAGNMGGDRTVELFSGPAGYSFNDTWYLGVPRFNVTNNQNATATTLKFPAGNYVWKITDDCGVYYVSVSVTAADLYQFTVGTPVQQASCQGLWITPTGTASTNGTSASVGFSILLNGQPLFVSTAPGTSSWPIYPLGTPILLTAPGTYTILATAGGAPVRVAGYYNPGGFTIGYPNIYTPSYTFTYTRQPLAVDINATQGFLCKGAFPGQGQIFVAGKGGIPFSSVPSPHYRYYLSLPGKAITGPFIDSNKTGIFTGFGANANALYDVKVADTCGAFAVQQVKILDLGTARLISSSHFVACVADSIQLSAVYLPAATYAWSGPAGFSSSLRQPVVRNVSALNAGVYRVTITTTYCNQTLRDSTRLVINQNPPKPLVSYTCLPRPIMLSVTNATSGFIYKWDIGRIFTSSAGLQFVHNILQNSDAPWTKSVRAIGSYMAVAVDTVTGCSSKSDSLVFLNSPFDTLEASIYSPHLQVCTGDTTILIAQWTGGALNTTFQWYRNGLPVAGANSISYITSQAGDYRVIIDGGLCNRDTSAVATVTVITRPVASLVTSADTICSGDTALLATGSTTGYNYTWTLNGTTIPRAFLPVYGATAGGSYVVTVANGGCVAVSSPVTITEIPSPDVTLTPAGPQDICAGDSVKLSAIANTLYTYAWSRNDTTITGASSNTYTVNQPGAYQLIISTAQCPHTGSPVIPVRLLPVSVNMGPDITVCADTLFPIPLGVKDGFTQITWSTGETTPQIKAPVSGIYWVSAVNSCGTFRDTVRILTPADYDPALPDDTLICIGAGSALIGVPPILQQIHWSTGANTAVIAADSPGVYTVEALSPCGPVYDTVQVRYCAPAIRELKLSGDSICEGGCVKMSAIVQQYPQRYKWIFDGGQPAGSDAASPGTVCYPSAGIYPVTLIVTNKGGSDTAVQDVVVSARPVPRFGDTVVTAPYKSFASLLACASAQRIDWYRNDTLVCADCRELHIEARYYLSRYRCVVRNGDCPDSCSYVLRVIDIPDELWLPDAFTPNGDGRNDIFRIITDNPNILVGNLDVYNRWGQRVFSSHLNNGGWDGTFHGTPAAAGAYFWQLRYKVLGNGEDLHERKGSVVLVR